jgi:hypothetical protein
VSYLRSRKRYKIPSVDFRNNASTCTYSRAFGGSTDLHRLFYNHFRLRTTKEASKRGGGVLCADPTSSLSAQLRHVILICLPHSISIRNQRAHFCPISSCTLLTEVIPPQNSMSDISSLKHCTFDVSYPDIPCNRRPRNQRSNERQLGQ